MFKCHVIICSFYVMLTMNESYAVFWCEDSAFRDLLWCLPDCNSPSDDLAKFYCRLYCAWLVGNCTPKLRQIKDFEVTKARKFYKCMKVCSDGMGLPHNSQSRYWKICDFQCRVKYLPYFFWQNKE